MFLFHATMCSYCGQVFCCSDRRRGHQQNCTECKLQPNLNSWKKHQSKALLGSVTSVARKTQHQQVAGVLRGRSEVGTPLRGHKRKAENFGTPLPASSTTENRTSRKLLKPLRRKFRVVQTISILASIVEEHNESVETVIASKQKPIVEESGKEESQLSGPLIDPYHEFKVGSLKESPIIMAQTRAKPVLATPTAAKVQPFPNSSLEKFLTSTPDELLSETSFRPNSNAVGAPLTSIRKGLQKSATNCSTPFVKKDCSAVTNPSEHPPTNGPGPATARQSVIETTATGSPIAEYATNLNHSENLRHANFYSTVNETNEAYFTCTSLSVSQAEEDS